MCKGRQEYYIIKLLYFNIIIFKFHLPSIFVFPYYLNVAKWQKTFVTKFYPPPVGGG